MFGAELFVQRGGGLLDELSPLLLPGSQLSFAEASAGFGELPAFLPHGLLAKPHGFFEQRHRVGHTTLFHEQIAMQDQRLC